MGLKEHEEKLKQGYEKKKEKIGLIQVDGIMPNIALMKLSKFYKDRGFDITLIDLSTLGIKKWIASKIFIGGSGYNLKEELPAEIEEITPDYDGFRIDYSIGFTSRGCIRNCDFCIVREKEGAIREVDIKWMNHSKVIIMDGNFLASPLWKQKLEYFIENNIKVNFNQGLDIRLINQQNAQLLLKTRSFDRKFKTRAYYFAFDDVNLKSIIERKIRILKEIGFKSKWIMFYILCGFNSSHSDDYLRFKIISDAGCIPYIMRYSNDDKWLNNFARFVNRKYYQFIPFNEYNDGTLII